MNNPFNPQHEDPQPRQDRWLVLAAIGIMVMAAAIELWRSSKNRLLRVPQNVTPPAPLTVVDAPITQQRPAAPMPPQSQFFQPPPAAPVPPPTLGSLLSSSEDARKSKQTERPALPTIKFSDRWFIYLLMVIAVVALLLNTPAPYSIYLIVALIIAASAWAIGQRVTPEGVVIEDGLTLPDAPIVRKVRTFSRTRILTLALYAVEIAAICVAGAWVTENYLRNNPQERITGGEEEWITSSSYFAAKALHEYGYIPLWDPFWEYGRPLIENPVSFITNPFSFIPSVLYGGTQGIKISAAVTVILAGIGGWVLAYSLGLGTLGRVLLAMLLIGKGGMIGMMREGYFQLGGSQAYIPWVMAGMLLTMRTRSRWPIVLTAVSFTLLFFAGNLWFTLPTLILMGLLALSHAFMGDNTERRARLQRLIFAGVLTVTLSMVVLLPAGLNFNRIGNHPEENGGGWYADMGDIFRTYTEPLVDIHMPNETISTWGFFGHIYIAYVTPVWLVILLFLLLPPALRMLYRPALRDEWRIWAVGIIMIAFCTLWGAGRLGLLYEIIPPLRQWRFVGRALAVAAFWIAVLIAMRADGLWRALLPAPSGEKVTAGGRFALRGALALGLA
ncbi:MAG: hypothetical protein H7175_22965, partial [Burkholderiales bacterium]|nr:hypothetical protein [Anaerolineae bacterium]